MKIFKKEEGSSLPRGLLLNLRLTRIIATPRKRLGDGKGAQSNATHDRSGLHGGFVSLLLVLKQQQQQPQNYTTSG